jgi:hypothetical protein
LTDLQTIDKTCLLLLLARWCVLCGGELLVFLCLLLAGGVNFVVISAMRCHLIMPIWFNLFQVESSILTILN